MGAYINGDYKSEYSGDQIDAAIGKVRTPDSTPTASSDNLVTSGGVKAALDQKQAVINDLSTIRQGASDGTAALTATSEIEQVMAQGYKYYGVATPNTNPGTLEQKVFYIASQPGTYTNLGGIVVNDGEVCTLMWNETSWSKQVTGAATAAQVSQLGQEIDGVPNYDTGYYLTSYGNPVQNENYCTSEYIPVDSSVQTSGIIVVYGTFKADARIVFYDANKDYIDGFGGNDGSTQRTFPQSMIDGVKYVRFSFLKNEIDSVGVKDARTLLFMWQPQVIPGLKGDVSKLKGDIENLKEKDISLESELGATNAQIDKDTISFDVVSGTSIPARAFYLTCAIKQGEDYILTADGPFTEIACYGITKEDVGVSLGSFFTSRSLSFTAAQDFVKLTFTIVSSSITGSGIGKLSISKKNNLNDRIAALEQKQDEEVNVFYGEKVASSSFYETVVLFNAKAGERISFIVRANAEDFKSKGTGDNAGINALTGIYLCYDDTDYALLTSGVNGTINLWHTFIAPHDLNSLKIYCDKANDIVDGASPLLSVEVRVGDANLPIPDYYFADMYLWNKIKRISEVVQNIDGDAFVFTTDEHWEYNRRYTPSILAYLAKRVFFSKHISTGDHQQVMALGTSASGGEDDNLNRYVKDFIEQYSKSSGKPFFSSVGNHEYLTDGYSAHRFDGVDLHNWVRSSFLMDNSGIIYGSREKLYYYFDDFEKNIRYIFLSSFTPQENVSNTQTVAISDYDSEQLTWLTNVALNVQNGWNVIVVTHNICSLNKTDPENIVPVFSTKEKEFLAALLDNNDDGKIVAVIAGHMHRDGLFLVKDSDVSANTGNSLFVVVTTCDANGFNWNSERITQYRPNGTTKEQAFDFVCFDRGKRMLDLIRIGAPANIAFQHEGTNEERIVRYGMQSVAVGETIALESVLDGTKTWTSKNENVATISDGVVTGIATGHCMIVVENEVHQVETFRIKVILNP